MRLVVAAALALLAAPAFGADVVCNPRDGGTRILQTANPNDIRPDWGGESRIGTGWSLIPARFLDSDGLDFVEGTLLSPRGSDQGAAFGLTREWQCISDGVELQPSFTLEPVN